MGTAQSNKLLMLCRPRDAVLVLLGHSACAANQDRAQDTPDMLKEAHFWFPWSSGTVIKADSSALGHQLL